MFFFNFILYFKAFMKFIIMKNNKKSIAQLLNNSKLNVLKGKEAKEVKGGFIIVVDIIVVDIIVG